MDTRLLCPVAILLTLIVTGCMMRDPPPQNCTADYGCGANEGSAPPGGSNGSTGPVCADGFRQCFGAVGINCSGAMPNGLPGPQVDGVVRVGCDGGECWISAGSWAHDQCCFTTPTGRWCGGPPSALNPGCVASWDRAVHRTSHALTWKKRVNMCRVDTDGIVNFAEYCAPNGTIVASNDENRCCGRLTRAYDDNNDIGRALAQGVVFDGSFTPRVCRSAAPVTPPVGKPKKCTSNAQCAEGETCAVPSGSIIKQCLPMMEI